MLSAEAEKRVKHILYCADQLMTKRTKLWQDRYDRAVKNAKTIEELDEAMLRINVKYKHLGLGDIIAEQRRVTSGS